MRIALDLTAAIKPKPTGVGWYATHLARALAARLGDDDELLLCARLSRWRKRQHRPSIPGERVHVRWFQEPFGPRGRPDVFHGPDARLPRGGPRARVATVHDVFSLESGAWANARFRERHGLPEAYLR